MVGVQDESLPRALRVRRRGDFLFLQRVGLRGNGRCLTVIARNVRDRHGRVGLTVPKKVGRAHLRNLVKRRLRHVLRTHKLWFATRDLVIIVREGAGEMSFDELGADLQTALDALSRARPHRRRSQKKR